MLWRLVTSVLFCISSFWIRVGGFKPLPPYISISDYNSHFQENAKTPYEKKHIVELFSSESSSESATWVAKNESTWLEEVTDNFVNQRPMGALTMADVQEARSLMHAWAKRGEPLQVELLLKRIIDDQNCGSDVFLSTRHYSIAMDGWAKSDYEGSAERAQEIHDNIKKMHEETQNSALAPSVISYSTLISAWIRQDPSRGIEQAERTFEEMKEAWLNGTYPLVKPDASTISQLLNGYGKAIALSNDLDYCNRQVERAQKLFDYMTEWNITKTVFCYGAIQNVYAQSQLIDAPFRAMKLLDDMMNETTTATKFQAFDEAEDNSENIDIYWKGNINGDDDTLMFKDTSGDSNASTSDRNGSHDEKYDSDGDTISNIFLRPTIVNFNSVLNACAKSATFESCRLARDLLELMPSKYGVEPVQLSFMMALQACVACSSPRSKNKTDHSHECAEIAMDILHELERAAERQWQSRSSVNQISLYTDHSNFQHKNAPARVTRDAYNKVLAVLARVSNLESITKMEELVKQMEEKAFSSGGSQSGVAIPNRRTYNSVLNAIVHLKLPYTDKWAMKAQKRQMAEKGATLLNHMWNMSTLFNTTDGYPDEKKDDWYLWIKPDSYSYTSVLRLYQKSILHGDGGTEAAQRVDDLVREMETFYDQGKLENPPDVVHYTIAIAAWAQSASPVDKSSRHRGRKNQSHRDEKTSTSVHRCAQILSHMMERHKAGYDNCVPNARTYNAYLDALSRGYYFEEAESVLYHLLHQYNFVYKRKNDAMAPDTFSFNTVMISMTRFAASHHDTDQNSLYDRAEAILDRVLEYCANENPKAVPNDRSFAILINHYTSSRGGRKIHALADRYNPDERPYRAEAVFDRMINYEGKLIAEDGMYTLLMLKVMDTFAQCHVPDGGKRAERLLQRMKEFSNRNNRTFVVDDNIVRHLMAAWGHSSHPQAAPRVEQYLAALEKRATQPTIKCYEIALHAWTRSQLVDIKASRALAVLQRLLRNQNIPRSGDEDTRNTDMAYCKSLVINACGFVSLTSQVQQAEAYQIALEIMNGLIDDGSALSLSYGWFLQLCVRFNNIPISERIEQVEIFFRDCCRKGMVNGFVWDQFAAVASHDLLQSIVRESSHDDFAEINSYLDLPKSWRCNASTRNRLREFF